jgi:hypothetical protein
MDQQFLTPDQLEDLRDGWHVAIVLGPSDLDVMHAALTLPYCDEASKRLSKEIQRQIRQRHFLNRVGEVAEGA